MGANLNPSELCSLLVYASCQSYRKSLVASRRGTVTFGGRNGGDVPAARATAVLVASGNAISSNLNRLAPPWKTMPALHFHTGEVAHEKRTQRHRQPSCHGR
jgi:hypothetical protein